MPESEFYAGDDEMPVPISLEDIDDMTKNEVVIRHTTCPAVALKIARTRIFLASDNENDRGLNCCFVKDGKLDGHEGFSNHVKCTGADVYFTWSGTVKEDPSQQKTTPDILWDQRTWRGFIPVGTTKSLRLSHIKLHDENGWLDEVVVPKFSFSHLGEWIKYMRNPLAYIKECLNKIDSEIYEARRENIIVMQGD